MNKSRVDSYIPQAVVALEESGIIIDGTKINKAFRGQVSAFGAAVASNSLISAIAFFSQQGNAAVERQRLIQAIEMIFTAEDGNNDTLFDRVRATASPEERFSLKERVLDAALALKLAMNLFQLTSD